MSTIHFSNGLNIEFKGTPTKEQIGKVVEQLKTQGKWKGAANDASSFSSALSQVQSEPQTSSFRQAVTGLGKGIAQGALETARGLQSMGESVGSTVLSALPGETFTKENLKKTVSAEGVPFLGAAQSGTAAAEKVDTALEPQTDLERKFKTAGRVVEFVGELLVPVGKVGQMKQITKTLGSVSESLVNLATGRVSQGLRSDLRKTFPIVGEAMPTFAKRYLEDFKFFATPKGGIETATKVLRETGTKFNEMAASEVGDRAVQFGDLLDTFSRNLKKLKDVIPDSEEKTRLLSKLSTNIRPTILWREALSLLRDARSLLPKSAFTGESKLSAAAENLRRGTDSLSKRLAEVASDTDFSKLNNAYSLFSDVRNQLIKEVSGSGGMLSKFVGAGAAGAVGAVKNLIPTKALELGAAKALDFARKGIEKSKKFF